MAYREGYPFLLGIRRRPRILSALTRARDSLLAREIAANNARLRTYRARKKTALSNMAGHARAKFPYLQAINIYCI